MNIYFLGAGDEGSSKKFHRGFDRRSNLNLSRRGGRVRWRGASGGVFRSNLADMRARQWRHARGKADAAAGAGSQCMTARGLYRYRISAHGPLVREREREKERRRTGSRGSRDHYDASGSFVARRPRVLRNFGYEIRAASRKEGTGAQCVTKVCDGIAEFTTPDGFGGATPA